MSDTSLVFNLIARDRMSGELNNVQGRFGRLRDTMKGLVGPALAFGAVNMLGGFISDARESAKIGKLTEQVIKSNGASAWTSATQVGDLATAISNKTGADDEAIQSGSNLLLTFAGIRNEAGKGNDVFNQTTQAAVDMTAAMNDGNVTQEGMKTSSMMLGKALNEPLSGMSKLTKSGVSFTQQQKDQVKAMVESGDKLGAQKLILAEVNKQFGGAAEAASNPMDKLKTSVGNLGETIGTALLPFVDTLTKKLTGVVKFVTDNSGWLLPLVGGLATLGATIFVIVKAVQAWTAVQAAFNIVMAMNPVVLIVAGIILLIGVIVLIATKTTWFQTLWKTVWGGIKAAASAVWNWLRDSVFNPLKNFFTVTIPNAAKFVWDKIKAAFNGIKSAVMTVWNWLANTVLKPIIWYYGTAVPAAVKFLWDKIKGAWNGIKSAVGAVWNWIKSNVLNPIKTFFTSTIPNAARTVKDKVVGAFTTVKNKMRELVSNAVGYVKDKFNSVVSFVRGLPGRISSAASGLFNGIKNAFKSAINWIIGKWNGLGFTIPSISVFGKKIGGGHIGTPNIPYLAKGGTLTGAGTVMVGERGPEMLSLPKGAQVNPLSRSGGSGGGGQVISIRFEKSGDPVLDALMDVMRDKIRVQYGGSVQTALGRG